MAASLTPESANLSMETQNDHTKIDLLLITRLQEMHYNRDSKWDTFLSICQISYNLGVLINWDTELLSEPLKQQFRKMSVILECAAMVSTNHIMRGNDSIRALCEFKSGLYLLRKSVDKSDDEYDVASINACLSRRLQSQKLSGLIPDSIPSTIHYWWKEAADEPIEDSSSDDNTSKEGGYHTESESEEDQSLT